MHDKVKGHELIDSITWDPHKTLQVPISVYNEAFGRNGHISFIKIEPNTLHLLITVISPFNSEDI